MTMNMTPEHIRQNMAAAEQAQARILAALPDFPRFGFYVKTGLAGYGPDLDENDWPAMSWDDVALQVAEELSHMADFNGDGASGLADQAREAYDRGRADFFTRAQAGFWEGVAETYHGADEARQLADELDILRLNFENLANAADPAPLYAGRPELRHAQIWDLITEKFPLDVSHNSRLYVWECTENPDQPGDDA